MIRFSAFKGKPMRNQDIVIVAAKRSPIGTLNGSLAPLQAHEIGAQVIAGMLEAAKIDPAIVDEAILGQVLTAGVGMNPARQATRAAGLPDAAPAIGVNQVCGSGLRAVALGAQQILAGDASCVLVGGQESMTNAPHVANLRQGKKLGDMVLTDTVMRDGLSDAFFGYPMGNTAENVAEKYGVTRAAQDEFALASQHKAAAAQEEGRFVDEIMPISIKTRKGETVFDADEYIRLEADAAGLEKLRPVFAKDGSVTAGNASGINDGAAALLLMSGERAAELGLSPLAKIKSWAHAGIDPAVMGMGPVPASQKALEKAGWALGGVDLWEINEAFAAQSLAVVSELGVDAARVNVNGGAIALGHPIGCSGARVLITLIYEMQRRAAKRGVATLCIGGGMGIAMCIEGA